MNYKVTGIVVAGGKSSRMGKNKALIEYKGKRLIDHAIEILEKHSSNIIVSSNINIVNLNWPLIKDEVPNIGPIGGLFTCLQKSKTNMNIIIPTDAPNVSATLHLNLLKNSDTYDAVIPVLPDGKTEPLIACYNKTIIKYIEHAINESDYKLMNLLKRANVNYINIADSNQFMNINAPQDLK